MLIEFRVANYLSFRDSATLSLVASKDTAHPGNTVVADGFEDLPLLKVAAVYGANASGKSNLLKALRFMQTFVTNSSKHGQEGDPIGVVPFKLDAELAGNPSEFEVVLALGGERYVYGFSADGTRVHEEWLTVAPPHRKARTLFRRTSDGEIAFGDTWQGERVRLQKLTRANALFLSVAMQFNNASVKPVFDWFQVRLSAAEPWAEDQLEGTLWLLAEHPPFAEYLDRFVRAADLGIDRFTVSRVPVTQRPFWSSLPEAVRVKWLADVPSGVTPTEPVARTIHRSSSGTGVPFDPAEESAGTQRLIGLAAPWFLAAAAKHCLLVDELETHLHPAMTRFLVNVLQESAGAQLIFTTHDCSLLDAGLFRRDQIWFTEKDPDTGATKLYSLYDYRVRKDENFRNGYLSGRYGAIPFVGEWTFGEAETADSGKPEPLVASAA
jgi:AAA15 family ATPase/GTPase